MALKIGILPVTALEQNCTLLWDDETLEGAVVDPGGDVNDILAAIAQTGMKLRGIYLTHGHFDHAGGAAELSEKTGVPVIGPEQGDAFLLGEIEATGRRYGLTGGRNCVPATWLKHGDVVKLGGADFEVRHVPGHTPGHVVFLNHERGFGIMGDVLFNGSVGRTDLGDYGNTEQLMEGIRTQLLTLPDDFGFTSGHGPGSSIGVERRSNPFL
jgi:glyoxylase-like metal-dependent hydrolase (beta-lactamase superfamily II)